MFRFIIIVVLFLSSTVLADDSSDFREDLVQEIAIKVLDARKALYYGHKEPEFGKARGLIREANDLVNKFKSADWFFLTTYEMQHDVLMSVRVSLNELYKFDNFIEAAAKDRIDLLDVSRPHDLFGFRVKVPDHILNRPVTLWEARRKHAKDEKLFLANNIKPVPHTPPWNNNKRYTVKQLVDYCRYWFRASAVFVAFPFTSGATDVDTDRLTLHIDYRGIITKYYWH